VAPGEGLAWSEMARGVLVHWVRLEAAAGGPRVADCRVLAPTDLNFHPRGVLARTLAALRGDAAADAGEQTAVVDRARVLAAAFDPCLHFEVMTPRDEEAAAHA
jgi:Ni,Fe-hydrogenase I large subunit